MRDWSVSISTSNDPILDPVGTASDLKIKRDTGSTVWLTDLIWATAVRLGYPSKRHGHSGHLQHEYRKGLPIGIAVAYEKLRQMPYAPDEPEQHTRASQSETVRQSGKSIWVGVLAGLIAFIYAVIDLVKWVWSG
jgi:hypothetical protein